MSSSHPEGGQLLHACGTLLSSWTHIAEAEAKKTRIGVEGVFPWEA